MENTGETMLGIVLLASAYLISASEITQPTLQNQANSLNPKVLQKAMTIVKCAKQKGIQHNHILSLIDYSLPSSKKRLWIFDLKNKKLLHHTYVSHGIKSGAHYSTFFSNKVNSKASSLGVYLTEKSYFGRHGYSLKLIGLDSNFNTNAYRRFIVMHGSWYVEDQFIKNYGRIGRSWGCPSVPLGLTKPIIDLIKERNLLIAFYPEQNWLNQSNFLNCNVADEKSTLPNHKSSIKQQENRGDVLYVDINHNKKRDVEEPVVTLSTKDYKQIFARKPPLKRMLRRQMNKQEFVVLNTTELTNLPQAFHPKVYFVKPVVKRLRGYYATEMSAVDLGSTNNLTKFTVISRTKAPIRILATSQFIRWLGL